MEAHQIQIPRLQLAQLPTPFYKLEGLTRALGGPDIFVKRDDLTGLGLGGNKIRKLEYLLADAREKGADVVLTTGGVQSNHCMLTAMSASKAGMECVLVLRGRRPDQLAGNLILSNLVSKIIFVDSRDKGHIDEVMADKAKRLKEEGKTPYIIPLGGSVPLGALGYWGAFQEIMEQAEGAGVKPTHVVFAWGSGGTQAGLAAGSLADGGSVEIMGINVDDTETVPAIEEMTSRLATETLALAGHQGRVKPEDIKVWNDYIGEDGYGKPSKAGLQALKTLTASEGILVDPVYTGKAMAGLIDLVKKGYFPREAKVVFIHTGGYGAIFASPESYISAGKGN